MAVVICITQARAMRAIGESYDLAQLPMGNSDDVLVAEFEPEGHLDADEWHCDAAWCPTNGSFQCDECMRHDPGSPYYAGGND